jgi:hypothetical protein
MDFDNKLKPKRAYNPEPEEEEDQLWNETFENLAAAGLQLVTGKGKPYFAFIDPKDNVEYFNVEFTPENLRFFSESLAKGIDPRTALKQRNATNKKPNPTQPKPEFTETVTPLSYNEKGGVATENKPTSVKKVK